MIAQPLPREPWTSKGKGEEKKREKGSKPTRHRPAEFMFIEP
jgi:hypothetical protein